MSMGLGATEYIKYWYSDISNANIIYAGTTAGLLKTSDKGQTWSRLSGTTEEAIGTFIDQLSATKRVYHATKTKIIYSDNGGSSFTTLYTPSSIQIRQFTAGVDTKGLTLAFGDNNGAGACSWASQYAASWGQASVDAVYNNCGYLWVNKYVAVS